MTLIKVLLFHVFILASVNILLAEEEANSEKAGLFGFPDFSSFFPGLGGGSGGGGFGNLFPGLGGGSGGGGFGNLFGREAETQEPGPGEFGDSPASDAHNNEDEHHNRFFFSLIPRLTSCNYTLQAGNTCTSCRQSLTCLPSNVGLLRTCRGLFRFCNNGYCSLFQGSLCTTSTSTNSTG